MAAHGIKSRFSVVWPLLLGVAFLSCSLFIFHCLFYTGRTCEDHVDCSSVRQATMLRSENCKSVCTTEDCIEISNTMMSFMNLSVQPCDNFYKYACGNLHEQHGKNANHSSLEYRREILLRTLKDVIETSEETQVPKSGAQKLNIVYESCMDTESLELTSIQSMQTFIQNIGIKNWPYLNASLIFHNPTFEDILGRLVTFEENIFVRFFTFDKRIYDPQLDGFLLHLTIDVPTPNDYNYKEEDMNDMVTEILRYVGMSDDDIDDTWNLFISIDRKFSDLKQENANENVICDGEDQSINIRIECNQSDNQYEKLCKMLNSVVNYGRLFSRFDTEVLFVRCTSLPYMKEFINLLDDYNHRMLAHYVALKVFLNNVKYMNFSLRKKFKTLVERPGIYLEEDGYLMEMERWKFCVAWTAKYMKLPLGFIYVNEMWPQEAIDKVDDIVTEYRNVISNLSLVQSTISEAARTFIAEQIQEMKNVIVHVIDLFKNRTVVNDNYKSFHPQEGNFIFNVMYNKQRHYISKYLNAVTETIVGVEVFIVSAFAARDIRLMFGILQPPVFKYSYPKLFNFAQIGQIIGHEMGHKYTMGLWHNFDEDNETAYLEENLKCRVKQYSKFEMNRMGKYIKANMTQTEDIADTIAMQVSEKVVKELLYDMSENMFTLPGLNFNAEQLFYISYAQVWCSVKSIERERLEWELDSHSPPEFRVNGPLQTSKRFSQVFKCPPSSFMNPQEKCLVFY